MPKIVKSGDSIGFFKNPICCKISKKSEGETLDTLKKFGKKVSQSRKKLKGGPLV